MVTTEMFLGIALLASMFLIGLLMGFIILLSWEVLEDSKKQRAKYHGSGADQGSYDRERHLKNLCAVLLGLFLGTLAGLFFGH